MSESICPIPWRLESSIIIKAVFIKRTCSYNTSRKNLKQLYKKLHILLEMAGRI